MRSASMNLKLGDGNDGDGRPKHHEVNPPCVIRMADFSVYSLSISSTFVFLDEHPDSMGFSPSFYQNGGTVSWIQAPASYHSGGFTISFADGHAEFKPWLDPSTRQPVTFGTWFGFPLADWRDWEWLWQMYVPGQRGQSADPLNGKPRCRESQAVSVLDICTPSDGDYGLTAM